MSNRINVNEADFAALKDKVVVLTGTCSVCTSAEAQLTLVGGGNGIGAATLSYLANAGAKVVFGDYDSKAGEKMAKSLSSAAKPPIFVQVNVAKYADNIKLFRTALDKFGKVDHGIACAGIVERGKWFDPELTIDSVEAVPSHETLDVNLLGSAYFTRIAAVYLKYGRKEGEDKSITIIASAAGFRDSPGLFVYQVRVYDDCVAALIHCWQRIVLETRRHGYLTWVEKDSL
jgi:NAD(P)-dependent dehydrogenase (short-subunit alcohol dehydrogenase family)